MGATFDDTLLTCVFEPRYMSFELCVCLEPVSKRFQQMANVFYRQLDYLDVAHFSARLPDVNWAQKIRGCCPNLKSIDKMPITKDNLQRDLINTQFVRKMTTVTRIGLELRHVSPFVMLFLGDMPNLTTVEICSTALSDPGDLKLVDKLRVTSLKCDHLSWMKFCDPNHLQVLHLSTCDGVTFGQLSDALGSFRNLREIAIRFQEYISVRYLIVLFKFRICQGFSGPAGEPGLCSQPDGAPNGAPREHPGTGRRASVDCWEVRRDTDFCAVRFAPVLSEPTVA